jgi:hypothetical protein
LSGAPAPEERRQLAERTLEESITAGGATDSVADRR